MYDFLNLSVFLIYLFFFCFQLLCEGVKFLKFWGFLEVNKKFEYRDSGVIYKLDCSVFVKFMSSNIFNMIINIILLDFFFSFFNIFNIRELL